LTLELDPDSFIDIRAVLVDGDSAKLSQVMRNLVSNALKFTPRGGKVQVKVTVLPALPTDGGNDASGDFCRTGLLKLQVTDSGPGISKVQWGPEDRCVDSIYLRDRCE